MEAQSAVWLALTVMAIHITSAGSRIKKMPGVLLLPSVFCNLEQTFGQIQ